MLIRVDMDWGHVSHSKLRHWQQDGACISHTSVLQQFAKILRTKIRTWQKVANSDQFCTRASSRHANFVDDIKRGSAGLLAKVGKPTNITES